MGLQPTPEQAGVCSTGRGRATTGGVPAQTGGDRRRAPGSTCCSRQSPTAGTSMGRRVLAAGWGRQLGTPGAWGAGVPAEQTAAGRLLDAQKQTIPGQEESRQTSGDTSSSDLCHVLQTGAKGAPPAGVGSPSHSELSCNIDPPWHRLPERAPGADKTEGTVSGQSLLHTQRFQHRNDPTQKLQGKQPYVSAQCQALLNKDKKEDRAFPPIRSSRLLLHSLAAVGTLKYLWIYSGWGVHSTLPMKHSPLALGSTSSRRTLQVTEGTWGPTQLQDLFHFLKQSSLFSSESGLAAAHLPEILNHHPSLAAFHRPFYS
ncbi:uncharacterized protein LOC116998469 [Catharus ustulatus]|uniref:uncharacterized protein LOC116998469 n=1 Tax=Catharus ustulatus TaxID=91951 RepID=UPI00140CBFFD|nr:uncharacterized protein LOC116998469 [Catharus ustulatus]